MFFDLLRAKLVWIPSVCFFFKFLYLSIFVFGAILLNRTGNLIAYVVALFVTSVFRLLSLRG